MKLFFEVALVVNALAAVAVLAVYLFWPTKWPSVRNFIAKVLECGL